MDSPELSVVIPAYLEEENLRLLLPRLIAVLDGQKISSEVLVVDTHEPMDNTRQLCEQLGGCIHYCPRTGGNNYGDAIRTGVSRARGRLVLFMDADGSHTPEFIPSLLARAEQCDVVVASRYVKGGATENPASLIWMSWMLNSMFRFVLQIPCRDVSNSFKIFHAELLKSSTLECNHFDIVEELLVRSAVVRSPLLIEEVPFVFKARMFGFTKRHLIPFVISFIKTLWRLFRIKQRARTQRQLSR